MMKIHLKIVLAILGVLLLGVPAFAQQRISGTITDSSGQPVIAAGVVQKDTQNGAVSDVNGKFVLSVPAGATVVVSSIGYKDFEFTVGTQTVWNIVLEEDTESLEGVEIVAYGKQQRVTVTGALSSVKAESIVRTPVSSVNNILAGQLSGVTTIQYSGEPGSDSAQIFVRGKGTWSNTSPLIQVDGVERSMSDINPEDIESITVLKDASATAVFGVRGANGVILVTTKRGEEGKARVNVTTSWSLVTPTALVKQADSYTYANFYNLMRRNDGLEDAFSPAVIQKFKDNSDPIRFPNTTWTTYIMKKVTDQSSHNINISGGTKAARYFVSVGLVTQGGLFNEFDLPYTFAYNNERFNYRGNLDLNVTPTTTLSFDVSGVVNKNYQPANSEGSMGILRYVYYATPFSSPGLVNGKRVDATNDYTDGVNLPFVGGHGMGYWGGGYGINSNNKLQMDLTLRQDLKFITKGLSFRIKGSYNNNFSNSKSVSTSKAVYYPVVQSDGSLKYRKSGEDTPFSYSEGMGRSRNWYVESSLNYDRKFGDHSVGGLVLYNQSKTYYPGSYSDIPSGYVGLVGRVTYDYKKRYLIEFNAGYNGSENFHPDRRFGFFPAGSVGWVVSDESFFAPLKSVVSFLKFRVSVGLVGNDRIGGSRFMYLADPYTVNNGSLATRSGAAYNFGIENGTTHNGAYENSRNNPNVTWEKALKQNYGVDLRFFAEKLDLSFDYYTEHRTGILLQDQSAPNIIGFKVPYANLGIVDSHGWEVTAKWNDRIGTDFRYFVNVNLSNNQNVVVEKKEKPYSNAYQFEKGHRIGARYMYQFFRYYDKDTPALYEKTFGKPYPKQLVDLKDGDAVFVDLDGNGVIDGNDMTRDLGYTDDPEYIIGVNAGFSWKNFDFSMQWTGAWNVTRVISESFRYPFKNRTDYNTGGLLQSMVDTSWSAENPSQSAQYPRPTWTNGQTNNYQDCALYEKNASYLRLKTAMIAYNIRPRQGNKLGLSNIQIGLSGYNMLTFTPYLWGDPESRASNEPTYPLSRTYTLSLKLNF